MIFYSFEAIDSCPFTQLNQLNKIGYVREFSASKRTEAFVGRTIALVCEDNTTRFEYDRYDNDPNDFRLEFICQPTKVFNLPAHDWKLNIHLTYPRCSGWCPSEKPLPPNSTGLYLSHKDRNSRSVYELISLIQIQRSICKFSFILQSFES